MKECGFPTPPVSGIFSAHLAVINEESISKASQYQLLVQVVMQGVSH